MERQCKNPKCGQTFDTKSIIHAFCSEACRKAARGTEYRHNRELAMIRDGYTCTECDVTEGLECHHILPLCQGGGNSLSNLQTLCKGHHRAKHRTWKGTTNGTKGTANETIESEVYDYAA